MLFPKFNDVYLGFDDGETNRNQFCINVGELGMILVCFRRFWEEFVRDRRGKSRKGKRVFLAYNCMPPTFIQGRQPICQSHRPLGRPKHSADV